MRVKIVFLAGVMLLMTPILLLGQADRGRITGTVTDTTGAVIPGAEIVATSTATQVETTAVSNEAGIYSLLNLPIGHYTLVFKKEGFKTLERSGITVSVAQAIKLDVPLDLGEIAETVTVKGQASLLQTENPEVGTTLRSAAVIDLPLAIAGGRELETFAYKITPAVEGNSWTANIAGSGAFTKEVLIDGTSGVTQVGGWLANSAPAHGDSGGVQSTDQWHGCGVWSNWGRSIQFRYEVGHQ